MPKIQSPAIILVGAQLGENIGKGRGLCIISA